MSDDQPLLDIKDAGVAAFSNGLRSLGIQLTDDQLARLDQFQALLLDWNQRVNLTAITDPGEVRTRHFLDSLSVLPMLPSRPCSLIDVGSGGGLPGIPIAIARSDITTTLLEATGKKCGFLEEAVHRLGLDQVLVLNQRAEIQGQMWGYRERFDVAVARGVAALPVLLELVLPFVRVGGHALCWKKGDVSAELREAKRPLRTMGGTLVGVKSVEMAGLEGHVIVSFQKLDNTPSQYPRRPGIPERRPLT